MATATLEATLERVGSHTVSTRGNWGPNHESEECFPVLKVEIGSTIREVRMEANRYRHSSGWSDWRIFVRDIAPSQGVGDVTRAKVRDACVPVVEAWLESDAYLTSRSRAFVWFIRNAIREERYNADRAVTMIASNQHELSDNQHELLTAAAEALARYLKALEAVNRETI